MEDADEIIVKLTAHDREMLRFVLDEEIDARRDALRDRRAAFGYSATEHLYEKSLANWEALRDKIKEAKV